MKFNLNMTVRTWIKDSHGLYDYQATEDNYHSETHTINYDCAVHRDNHGTFSIHLECKTHLVTGQSL